MARESDYQKAAQDDSLNREHIIQNKLNQSDIGTKELAIVLQMEERSVRNFLRKLCDNHPELKLDSFKEGRSYKFKAEWNGLLATLGEVSEFSNYDTRKNVNSLEDFFGQRDYLIEAVDIYLNQQDREMVKSHVTYQEAVLEKDLHEILNHRINSSLNQIGMMPSSLRFQTLFALEQLIENVDINLARRHSQYLINKSLYTAEIENSDPTARNNTSFKEDLEEYLVSLLNLRLHNISYNKESVDVEVASSALIDQIILRNITKGNTLEINNLAEKKRKIILESPSIVSIIEKVKEVLDEDDPLEAKLLQWLELTIKIVMLGWENQGENRSFGREGLRQMFISEVEESIKSFTKM